MKDLLNNSFDRLSSNHLLRGFGNIFFTCFLILISYFASTAFDSFDKSWHYFATNGIIIFTASVILFQLFLFLRPKTIIKQDRHTNIKQENRDFYLEANNHLDKMIFRLSIFENLWVFFGVLCIFLAGYFAWMSYDNTYEFISSTHQKPEVPHSLGLHYILLIKGLFLTGVPATLATFCFKLSKSYIHERLKRQERKHAIHFGKFVLEKYEIDSLSQENIELKDLIDTFQWNIANDTAFNRSDYAKLENHHLKELINIIKSYKLVDKKISST